MQIGIVGAGVVDFQLDKHKHYIGVDGGIDYLIQQNIEPIFIVGDFDSLQHQEYIKQYESIQLPTQKDDTDLAIAIEYAIKKGYTDIELYGVTGGRIDHFMAVLCLLKKYEHIHLTIFDRYNKIYLCQKGQHTLYKESYQYISFFALKSTLISIEGCLYPLTQYQLEIDNPLCVSNEITGLSMNLEVDQTILVIQSNSKG